MPIEIGQASMALADDIAQLSAELGYPVGNEQTKQWLSELMTSVHHRVLVARCEQAVCGWLVVEKRLFLESGYSAEITGLVVGAAFRRQGIAGALVAGAELWAKQQDVHRLVVRSNAARKESHIFYPSVGFVHSKTSQVYVKALDLR